MSRNQQATPAPPTTPPTTPPPTPPAEVRVGPYLVREGSLRYGTFDLTPALAALKEQALTPEQLVALAKRLKPLAITRNKLTPRSELVLKLAVGEIIAADLQPN
jgi:hypothetical protein